MDRVSYRARERRGRASSRQATFRVPPGAVSRGRLAEPDAVLGEIAVSDVYAGGMCDKLTRRPLAFARNRSCSCVFLG
jgi:hypothetical protein